MPDTPGSPNPQPTGRDSVRLALRLSLVFVGVYLVLQWLDAPAQETLSYSAFKDHIAAGEITQVMLAGDQVTGERTGTKAGQGPVAFKVTLPAWEDPGLWPLLAEHEVEVRTRPAEAPMWLRVVGLALPWLLILGLVVYSTRMMQQRLGGGGLFDFSKSRARRYDKQRLHIGFEDVAGLDAAKHDLREIIDYLRDPEKFDALGAKMPRGILMMGPPGTGKTLLAKAVAGEAEVPFFSISGSEFIEMFVGVGASRVREMFKQARAEAPALVFIDEIDSVGRARGTGLGGGNDEREQTLNQILSEMDGFEPGEPVVVLAATNRPDVLDPALLRPGRFDRKVTLDLPQLAARRAILDVHTKRTPLAADVDLDRVAAQTVGFSGADIENLVNEAALHAVGRESHEVSDADFEVARDKIVLGSERQQLTDPEERRRVAWHESGHATLAFFAEHADPLSRVSIIPRGRALGVTEQLRSEDRYNFTEAYLDDQLSILLGGRAAERLVFSTLSSGAADDLRRATGLARRMVAEWGMSDALGPVSRPVSEEHPFLGREIAQSREFSEATLRSIDIEVDRRLARAEQRALAVLRAHRVQLDALAERLLRQETLHDAEIAAVLDSPEVPALANTEPATTPRGVDSRG
ncbi:MAG: ATP-dependent zinc metalloprotease FtsH [Pseudomonadota bacterium]|nr:ATP-dependent zinc metalloprotease FtsH [Pseudomonadota bacterium]